MEELLPSEIARLVLGYIEEDDNCGDLAKRFLESSQNLRECLEVSRRGGRVKTRVEGYSLETILHEYCAVQRFVAARCKQLRGSDTRRFRQQEGMVEKLEFLFRHTPSAQTPGESATGESPAPSVVQRLPAGDLTPAGGPRTPGAPRTCEGDNLAASQHHVTGPGDAKADGRLPGTNAAEVGHTAATVAPVPHTPTKGFVDAQPPSTSGTPSVKRKCPNSVVKRNNSSSAGPTVITPNKSRHKAGSEEGDSNGSLDFSALQQAFLGNTELHQRIAENINRALHSHETVGLEPGTPAPLQQQQQQQQTDNMTSELDQAIKSIVDRTEQDPLFERFLDEIIFPFDDSQTEEFAGDTSRSKLSSPRGSNVSIVGGGVSPPGGEVPLKRRLRSAARREPPDNSSSPNEQQQRLQPEATLEDQNNAAIEFILGASSSMGAGDEGTLNTPPKTGDALPPRLPQVPLPPTGAETPDVLATYHPSRATLTYTDIVRQATGEGTPPPRPAGHRVMFDEIVSVAGATSRPGGLRCEPCFLQGSRVTFLKPPAQMEIVSMPVVVNRRPVDPLAHTKLALPQRPNTVRNATSDYVKILPKQTQPPKQPPRGRQKPELQRQRERQAAARLKALTRQMVEAGAMPPPNNNNYEVPSHSTITICADTSAEFLLRDAGPAMQRELFCALSLESSANTAGLPVLGTPVKTMAAPLVVTGPPMNTRPSVVVTAPSFAVADPSTNTVPYAAVTGPSANTVPSVVVSGPSTNTGPSLVVTGPSTNTDPSANTGRSVAITSPSASTVPSVGVTNPSADTFPPDKPSTIVDLPHVGTSAEEGDGKIFETNDDVEEDATSKAEPATMTEPKSASVARPSLRKAKRKHESAKKKPSTIVEEAGSSTTEGGVDVVKPKATPTLQTRQPGKRLSLSTPRRVRSHVRALDFTTPPKHYFSPRRRATTSPKGSLLLHAGRSPRSLLKSGKASKFKSPPAKRVRSSLFRSPDAVPNVKGGDSPATSTSTDRPKSDEKTIVESEPVATEPVYPVSLMNWSLTRLDTPIKAPVATRPPATHLSGDWDRVTGVGMILADSPSKGVNIWDANLRALLPVTPDPPKPPKNVGKTAPKTPNEKAAKQKPPPKRKPPKDENNKKKKKRQSPHGEPPRAKTVRSKLSEELKKKVIQSPTNLKASKRNLVSQTAASTPSHHLPQDGDGDSLTVSVSIKEKTVASRSIARDLGRPPGFATSTPRVAKKEIVAETVTAAPTPLPPLVTPLKDESNSVPMTPRLLSPGDDPDTPLTRLIRGDPLFDCSMIPTPFFRLTPGIARTPDVDARSPMSSPLTPASFRSSYFEPRSQQSARSDASPAPGAEPTKNVTEKEDVDVTEKVATIDDNDAAQLAGCSRTSARIAARQKSPAKKKKNKKTEEPSMDDLIQKCLNRVKVSVYGNIGEPEADSSDSSSSSSSDSSSCSCSDSNCSCSQFESDEEDSRHSVQGGQTPPQRVKSPRKRPVTTLDAKPSPKIKWAKAKTSNVAKQGEPASKTVSSAYRKREITAGSGAESKSEHLPPKRTGEVSTQVSPSKKASKVFARLSPSKKTSKVSAQLSPLKRTPKVSPSKKVSAQQSPLTRPPRKISRSCPVTPAADLVSDLEAKRLRTMSKLKSTPQPRLKSAQKQSVSALLRPAKGKQTSGGAKNAKDTTESAKNRPTNILVARHMPRKGTVSPRKPLSVIAEELLKKKGETMGLLSGGGVFGGEGKREEGNAITNEKVTTKEEGKARPKEDKARPKEEKARTNVEGKAAEDPSTKPETVGAKEPDLHLSSEVPSEKSVITGGGPAKRANVEAVGETPVGEKITAKVSPRTDITDIGDGRYSAKSNSSGFPSLRLSLSASEDEVKATTNSSLTGEVPTVVAIHRTPREGFVAVTYRGDGPSPRRSHREDMSDYTASYWVEAETETEEDVETKCTVSAFHVLFSTLAGAKVAERKTISRREMNKRPNVDPYDRLGQDRLDSDIWNHRARRSVSRCSSIEDGPPVRATARRDHPDRHREASRSTSGGGHSSSSGTARRDRVPAGRKRRDDPVVKLKSGSEYVSPLDNLYKPVDDRGRFARMGDGRKTSEGRGDRGTQPSEHRSKRDEGRGERLESSGGDKSSKRGSDTKPHADRRKSLDSGGESSKRRSDTKPDTHRRKSLDSEEQRHKSNPKPHASQHPSESVRERKKLNSEGESSTHKNNHKAHTAKRKSLNSEDERSKRKSIPKPYTERVGETKLMNSEVESSTHKSNHKPHAAKRKSLNSDDESSKHKSIPKLNASHCRPERVVETKLLDSEGESSTHNNHKPYAVKRKPLISEDDSSKLKTIPKLNATCQRRHENAGRGTSLDSEGKVDATRGDLLARVATPGRDVKRAGSMTPLDDDLMTYAIVGSIREETDESDGSAFSSARKKKGGGNHPLPLKKRKASTGDAPEQSSKKPRLEDPQALLKHVDLDRFLSALHGED